MDACLRYATKAELRAMVDELRQAAAPARGCAEGGRGGVGHNRRGRRLRREAELGIEIFGRGREGTSDPASRHRFRSSFRMETGPSCLTNSVRELEDGAGGSPNRDYGRTPTRTPTTNLRSNPADGRTPPTNQPMVEPRPCAPEVPKSVCAFRVRLGYARLGMGRSRGDASQVLGEIGALFDC